MGGCVSSRSEFPTSTHPNVFTVYPVSRPASADAIESSSISGATTTSGLTNSSGQLEVRPNEMVLHRRGHEPVHWPLQYVRRYGYENHLFSFESGRRCESGPGIFTFRCRRAHELFLLVQANVQEARTPPGGSQPQGLSLENAVAALERGRSGSMPSQFRFPVPGRLGQHVTRSEANTLMGRSPDSLLGQQEEEIYHVLPTPQEEPDTNINGQCTSTVEPTDTDASHVFVDISPQNGRVDKAQPSQQHRARFTSARSRESSATSYHSNSSAEKSRRRRPNSFEFMALSSSQDGADSSAFVSPSVEAAVGTSPTMPPSTAYYVNVDPAISDASQKKSYQNKLLMGLRRAPGRSQSLGSASTPEPEEAQVKSNSGSASPSSKGARMKTDQSINSDPGTGPLDYVTVDVGQAPPLTMTGRSTWSSSTPTAFYKHYHKRQSSQHSNTLPNGSLFGVVGRSLASVSEVGNSNYAQCKITHTNGDQHPNSAHQPKKEPNGAGPSGISNYAHIDCTRTKALRETAAAAQLQRRSTSCSASSSEAMVITEPSGGGRRKHADNLLPFTRRKHDSGNLERKS